MKAINALPPDVAMTVLENLPDDATEEMIETAAFDAFLEVLAARIKNKTDVNP